MMLEAIGWTLLHSLWEGAIIAAALAVALALTRNPRTRYAAACGALLLLLGAFAITLLRMIPESHRTLSTLHPSPLQAWIPIVTAPRITPAFNLAAIVPWFAPPWIAGVIAFYIWHAASWISVSRLRRRGVCTAPAEWQHRVASLCEDLRLSRPVELLESCLIDAPIVLGHFRPVILMPVGLLTGLPVRHIEAILLHELAHISRHDYLINVLQRFVEGLMFYHPAAWWISRVIRAERENCCDDAAVAQTGDSREYAAALATLEENRQPHQLALAATGGSLMQRIHRLLYPTRPRTAWTPLVASIALMTIATAGLTAWQTKPPEQEGVISQIVTDDGKQTQVRGVIARVVSDGDKWLNQDVAYIITDTERAAFLKLATDAERDNFKEQFWLRRNPTPGTATNEFKDEHYRRLAYVNERYASAKPGWQTDRGHMYIIYGPPDEIDAHPSGEPGKFPHETWKYNYVEGIGSNLFFTFIDRNRNGQYQLAPATDH
ncbi:MAG TPA: GWxTD domain-containing protein [Bryobacteraceae bacterium]|jgi:GWxTD domain-containing protein